MNVRLGRAIVNKNGIRILLKDMAHPQMKKAWFRNVFANIWHFIQGKKKQPQTKPPLFPLGSSTFFCLFPPNKN